MFKIPKISRRQFLIDMFTLTSSVFILDAFWLEKYFIETNEYYLDDADRNSDNLKIIQISDLHLQSIGRNHRNLAKKINKINPDLLLFTGDSIDRYKKQIVFDEFLSLFDHHIKKVAILGNREYERGIIINELGDIYKKHNGYLLINESRKYQFGNSSISITGIDDFMAGTADFKKAVKNYKSADHHVVLTHCPQHRDIIKDEMGNIPIDLVLSGHTHGGQIKILGYAPFTPGGSGRYVNGWYKESRPHLYVSKGIGTTAYPIRFGSRAEIAIFNLTKS
ncbi:metallophosphoesterase [Daejeonella oryzae]|uniref:metallophosphoesterase n=1 Tax=Daejeonella oryzae TaxID=1122943 RepID=UPI000425C8F7|nr:metallophosphoesterase [Daejeonella oryzae]